MNSHSMIKFTKNRDGKLHDKLLRPSYNQYANHEPEYVTYIAA